MLYSQHLQSHLGTEPEINGGGFPEKSFLFESRPNWARKVRELFLNPWFKWTWETGTGDMGDKGRGCVIWWKRLRGERKRWRRKWRDFCNGQAGWQTENTLRGPLILILNLFFFLYDNIWVEDGKQMEAVWLQSGSGHSHLSACNSRVRVSQIHKYPFSECPKSEYHIWKSSE